MPVGSSVVLPSGNVFADQFLYNRNQYVKTNDSRRQLKENHMKILKLTIPTNMAKKIDPRALHRLLCIVPVEVPARDCIDAYHGPFSITLLQPPTEILGSLKPFFKRDC